MQIRFGLFSILIFIINIFIIYSVLGNSRIEAVLIETPPRIDGRVVEDVWFKAAVVDQFFQREPDTGQPSSQPTEFYVCYDRNYLYIGVKCYDDPAKVTAKEMARDASLKYDDKVAIIIDTFLDRRNAYWFQINPRGCIGDGILSQNGAALNKQWDGLWEGRAKIHEKGWDAEIAIPFKTLSFHPGQTTWGIKFMREIQRRSEKVYWPVANLDTYKFQVSDAGLLEGLDGISQGVGLDVAPYVLVGLDQKVGTNYKYPSDAGVDIFYQITSGIKSAITINTDFAQTEVDDRQINLTRFRLHFPEKRDFFLDGASYFQFGREGDRQNRYAKKLIPFFSRRLGLDKDGNPIPIVWGAKVTGQVGKWNLGFLNIMDERSTGKKNFTVNRVSRNFGSQSSIGMIATHGNALSEDDNLLLGVDVRLATSTFRGNKNLAFLGYLLKSKTTGLSGNDFAFGSEIVYPNDFLFFRTGYHQIEENFRAGVGFVPRLNYRESYAEILFGPRPKRWGILQIKFGSELDYLTDLNNYLLTREVRFIPFSIYFNSGDEIAFDISQRYEFLDKPFNIYTDHIIDPGIYSFWRYQIRVGSAQRRNFWTTVNYNWGDFWNGENKQLQLAMGYKITVPLFMGLQLEHNDVSLIDGAFNAKVVRLNADILFSPRITLSNFIQYDNFSKEMGWQSRFRWILKPGNEILLVWNSIWEEPLERYEISQSASRLKFCYNYRF